MSVPLPLTDDAVISLPETLLQDDRSDHFVRREGKIYAGTHLIVEVIGGSGLDCPIRIEHALRACVHACKATLLHLHVHRFQPQGVSGVAVLAESHISVHTWPEQDTARLTSSCAAMQSLGAPLKCCASPFRRMKSRLKLCCAVRGLSDVWKDVWRRWSEIRTDAECACHGCAARNRGDRRR